LRLSSRPIFARRSDKVELNSQLKLGIAARELATLNGNRELGAEKRNGFQQAEKE
jgi:hypothetical protein